MSLHFAHYLKVVAIEKPDQQLISLWVLIAKNISKLPQLFLGETMKN
jgi:hypothetical protein